MPSIIRASVRPYRSLAFGHFGFEEAAARVNTIHNLPSGIAFARKDFRSSLQKIEARRQVIELFSNACEDKHQKFFTMPGAHWKFESALCGELLQKGRRGHFYCCENDASVYLAALRSMPGKHNGFKVIDHRTTQTWMVTRYRKIDVEDYAKETSAKFVGAWLDFTGPVSLRRIDAIKTLFRKSAFVVATFLEARWAEEIDALIREHGSYEAAICAGVEAQPLTVHRYFDCVPMIQIAWRTGFNAEGHSNTAPQEAA